MKKALISFVLLSLLATPIVVLAGIIPGVDPPPAPDTSIPILLNSITNWLFAMLLVLAAIFIIIAGYYFVTAQGDPEKTKTARNFVLYALIGVLVGFAARGLVSLVARIVEPSLDGASRWWMF